VSRYWNWDAMRVRSISHTKSAAGVLILAWGSLAVALVSQHAFGYEPCPWCIVQRLAYIAVGCFALAALPIRQSAAMARLLLGLAMLAAIGGLVAALYQHLVAAPAGSCALTKADRFLMTTGLDEALPGLFKATAACDEANRAMLGVPYSLWSAALAILLIGLLAHGLFRTSQRG
jgi:protein dithiol:quinone oxidoreductase